MRNLGLTDTIAAMGTGLGEAGIGIVRISGKDALKIADRVFVAKGGKKPSGFKAYTVHYGWIVERNQKPVARNQKLKIIDEVLLTVMRKPKSYTKEDVVEINCHGGIMAMRAVSDLVLENGARLAEPGEFTKRAFLNGRIDLAQAEAVLDIIRAKTDSALKIGTEQLRGTLSNQINRLRKGLLDALAILEANIDFPEEEIGVLNLKEAFKKLNAVNGALKGILVSSKHGKVLRDGIQAVICGKPNVGKSSLLNALLKQERSIVSSISGTTRDTIEEIIDIKGIPVRIVDTAGIIEPRDLVEKKAVSRSKRHIGFADLVILLFDGSQKLTKDDEALIKKLRKKQIIAIINKIDLRQKIDKIKIEEIFKHVIGLSAKKLQNIGLLEEAIADLVFGGKVIKSESALVSNLRHIELLKEAENFIDSALKSLDNKVSVEFVAQDIKGALGSFDTVSGKNFSEDLLEKIFSEFCIGK
ncbi:MAG: tRNA uridine-5-carboxymethylaminomethyl(34) synthesis GTPase MnmE [Candidatus Omnitrophota bacterium]|nr:tRNA uridine-5-carboxymethylaminomethyl(34) synthesis GTPase MnmE [Candidatus Omnitrophota bacterium]